MTRCLQNPMQEALAECTAILHGHTAFRNEQHVCSDCEISEVDRRRIEWFR